MQYSGIPTATRRSQHLSALPVRQVAERSVGSGGLILSMEAKNKKSEGSFRSLPAYFYLVIIISGCLYNFIKSERFSSPNLSRRPSTRLIACVINLNNYFNSEIFTCHEIS